MEVETLIAQLRSRQLRLKSQIERDQMDLEEIIVTLHRLESEMGIAVPIDSYRPRKRIPLAERTEVVLDLLKKHGSLRRVDILKATGLPAGSLSAVLNQGLSAGIFVREGDAWGAAGRRTEGAG